MGMYDVFLPVPALPCKWCGAELSNDFQGKCGPCRMLIWREGEAAAVGEQCDVESRMPAEERRKLRLPSLFGFCTLCPSCGSSSEFTGVCRDGTWVDSILGCFDSITSRVRARDLGSGHRQCSECCAWWEWPVARRLSECPACHMLTELEACDDRIAVNATSQSLPSTVTTVSDCHRHVGLPRLEIMRT